MRSLLLLTIFMASRVFSTDKPIDQFVAQSPDKSNAPYPHLFINPTGTYVLMGTIKKNKVIGHSGEIRVQLLDSNTVAVCFYITKGYPGYESGSFTDTLAYDDNQVRYSPPGAPDCTIVLDFRIRKVELMQVYSDPRCQCGFAEGVMAAATFEKTSSERPIIQDLALHRT